MLAPPELVWTAGFTGVSVAAGAAVTVAAAGHRAALLVAAALPVLLHWAGRGYADADADLARMRRLQAATHALSATIDPREDAEAFVAEVARCCSAQAALLALVRDDRLETHQSTVTPEAGRPVGGGDRTGAAALLFAGALPAIGVAEPRRPPRWRVRYLDGWRRSAPVVETNDTVIAAARAAGRRDCLAVPVQSDDGRRLGVLAVYDRSGFTDRDRADVVTLQALAGEVTAAVRRADLVQEAVDARQNSARIVQGSNDGIVALTEDGSVVTWNPAFAALTGEPAEGMLGAGHLCRLDARDASGRAVELEGWTDGGPLPTELSIRSADGQRRWLSCSYARTTADGSTGPLLVIMVRDVTELRRQRSLIAMQRRVLELVASDVPTVTSLGVIATLISVQLERPAAVVLTEGDEDAPRFASVLAHDNGPQPLPDREELLARLGVVGPERWRAVAARATPLVLEPSGPAVSAATMPGGPGRPADVRRPERPWWAMPVLETGQFWLRGVLVVLAPGAHEPDDHTLEVLRTGARLASICLERAAAQSRLAHQANHDPLTGLPNRLLFLDRCERALLAARRRNEYAVVLFIDLDRFKVVNDSLGHDAGDQLLVAVAARLRQGVRPFDTIARFGGDEFTVLCEELPAAEGAGIIAERILALFAAPFDLLGREVFETASVGVALDRAPQRAEDLIQHADAAMYRAKASGGNRYEFYDVRLARQAQARLASYTALRRAVDAGEFEVHYQPTVDLVDGTPVGVEALARWRHPTRGLLAPEAFIDLAEETGMIVPLGTQVLRTALREIPDAPPHGSTQPLRISVNLSARQLSHPDLTPMVSQALADAGVPPARLSLEITESLLITDSSAMQAAIADLKQLGVGLCLDDFGTGHSSMDYLKFLPVDELKIERRFVVGLLTNDQDRAIVSAIIRLGHDLGLRVVAEGIGTAAQADRLRDMGCDVGQGYHFGRPMPAPKVLDLTGVAAR